MRKIGMFVLFAVAVASLNVRPVQAFPPFKKEFENLYVKENPATPEETKLKESVTRQPSAAFATPAPRERTRKFAIPTARRSRS